MAMLDVNCSIDGCERPIRSGALCSKHYQRLRKYGDPLFTKMTPSGEAQKFYRDVVLSYEGKDCLQWPYARVEGYGVILREGRSGVVSRFVCEDTYGPPPSPDHQAAHSCGKGRDGCVNKGHLSWKTPTENQADKLIHGTHNRGERSNFAKLNEPQVREVLSLKGAETPSMIADRFGVSRTTISRIHSGKIWASIEGART